MAGAMGGPRRPGTSSSLACSRRETAMMRERAAGASGARERRQTTPSPWSLSPQALRPAASLLQSSQQRLLRRPRQRSTRAWASGLPRVRTPPLRTRTRPPCCRAPLARGALPLPLQLYHSAQLSCSRPAPNSCPQQLQWQRAVQNGLQLELLQTGQSWLTLLACAG